MKDKELMRWIYNNLGGHIQEAIKGTFFTESWLAGICARETGFLINRYVAKKLDFDEICLLMRGDYSRRKGESEPTYHGFSFFQIDIASFPQFVASGAWKDPLLSAKKAVRVLQAKRAYLVSKGWNNRMAPYQFDRATTAAYNCGEFNVHKALLRGKDVDIYTYNHDYSREVFRYAYLYPFY